METLFRECDVRMRSTPVRNPLLSERDGNLPSLIPPSYFSLLSETHYSLKEMETIKQPFPALPCFSSETHYSLKEMETELS